MATSTFAPITSKPFKLSITATSTTTLDKSTHKSDIRNQFQPYLKANIKKTRTQTKANHHKELQSEALKTNTPPRGLHPNINPRIPHAKEVDFIIAWEKITQRAALDYTKVLLNHWTKCAEDSERKSEQLKDCMLEEGLTSSEWN